MKKKICLLLVGALLLTGCGKVPKLQNGQDAVVTFKNGEKISVDDLYNKMKDTYALSTIVTMIDKTVLESAFSDYKDTATKYTDSYVEAIKQNYDSDDELLKAIQSNTGFSSLEAYKEYIYMSYMQSHAAEEYAKTQVTDKQIENYYKNKTVGDVEISHILITPEVNDKMSEDEIKKAEDAAKKEAEEIIATLKSTSKDKLADKFAELAKEKSDDAATKENGGSIGRINKSSLDSTYDELASAAYSISDGTFYGKVITTELGYHILYKTKTYEKDSLENLKSSITTTLANELLKEKTSMATEALQHYRKEQGVEIQDSTIKNQYAAYIQNSLTADMK